MEKKNRDVIVGTAVLLSSAVGIWYLLSGKRYPSIRHVPLNELITELSKRLA